MPGAAIRRPASRTRPDTTAWEPSQVLTADPAKSLHHSRTGEGPALLLLHGLGGTGVVWRPVLDRLAAEREVIVVDMPGFGRSPALSEGVAPSALNLAAAVTAFCDAQLTRRRARQGLFPL